MPTVTEDMNPYEKRVYHAINCEAVDRTAFACTEVPQLGLLSDPRFVMGDCYRRPDWAMDRILDGAAKLDGDLAPFFQYAAGSNFMTKEGTVYVMPGRDSPAEASIQVIEHNYMDDPDTQYPDLIENGWAAFVDKYVMVHKNMPQDEEDFNRSMELGETFAEKIVASGLQSCDLWSGMVWADCGFYYLSMLRGFSNFLKDLRKRPDQVHAAIDAIDQGMLDETLPMADEMGAASLTTSLVRVDNNAMSRKMFEEFVWPSIMRFHKVAMDRNMIHVIHADGCYDNDADLFAQLTPQHTIMQHDGFSNPDALAPTYRERKICFYGDIPPQVMALGTPEEVTARAMHLKQLFGPGLILAAGCAYPPNTKEENLWALRKAADDMDF